MNTEAIKTQIATEAHAAAQGFLDRECEMLIPTWEAFEAAS